MMFYFVIGAAFPLAAGLAQRRGGWRLLLGVCVLAAASLAAVGIWQEKPANGGDGDFGLPILLSLAAPTVTGAIIRWLGGARSPLWAQWLLGFLVWIVIFLPVGLVAVLLGWVTF